jgi:hypothetical protein
VITDAAGKEHDSGLVMYPAGHARNTTNDLEGILKQKFHALAALSVGEPDELLAKLSDLPSKSAAEIAKLYGDIEIDFKHRPHAADATPKKSASRGRKRSKPDDDDKSKAEKDENAMAVEEY